MLEHKPLGSVNDGIRARYEAEVRHDVTGLGLGTRLMKQIIDYARSRGIHTLWGITLKENKGMRGLARALQFTERQDPDDSTLVRMSLDLSVGG